MDPTGPTSSPTPNSDSAPNQGPPEHEEPTFISLHPQVVLLWRAQQAVASVVILIAGFIAVIAAGLNMPEAWPWLLSAWALLAIFRGFLLVWYPPRAYSAWGYRLDEKVLEIKSGVVFRTIQLLPLSRLQHVDLHRGPIERYFGLASLVLYTAGTQEAIMSIPGLETNEATRLRDQLVALGGENGA